MNAQTVRILTKAWYGDEEMELQFPETWEVQECRMAGHDMPPLTNERIHDALKHPLGTKPLHEMANGKKQVVILFDDLARPTPIWKILPFVLKELKEAGISDDQIRFVAAHGTHLPLRQGDFVKKLTKEVVNRFRVYNHNPYEHLINLSKTSRGTQILINQEVMNCDLKIGIGALVPHDSAGFSGGAKIILPGVAGIESIYQHHLNFGGLVRDLSGKKFHLRSEENDFRQDIEEIGRIAGLDMKIDLLLNYKREVIGVFAGDFVIQHRTGMEKAKKIYATPIAKDCDIVVTNAYPIENQISRAFWPANLSLKQGGHSVVISQAVEGQGLLYLSGRFGTNYGGKMWNPLQKPPIPNSQRILICSPYLSRTDLDRWGPPDRVQLCETWGEVLSQLMAVYPRTAKVAVYPYAPIQVPEET